MDKLIESLSPNERKILPFLQQDFDSVSAKSGLDKVSVLRALEFLNSKKLQEKRTARKTAYSDY